MLSKICVLFLVWMIVGFLVIAVNSVRYAVKLYCIDPDDDNLCDEFLEMAFNSIPTLRGIRAAKRSLKEMNEDIDRATKSSLFERVFRCCIAWPSTIGVITPYFDAAYEQIKNEYDTGIRTRKSPQ